MITEEATVEKVSVKPRVMVDYFLEDLETEAIVRSIADGLRGKRKRISCVFLYDCAGSKLFEKITGLDEYYPGRTEKSLLGEACLYIRDHLRDVDIIELGSGDCSKISILLDAVEAENLKTLRYLPVDVSRSAVEESARILFRRFPGITIHGVVADFMQQLDLIPKCGRRFFCFLGSTIGNLSQDDAVEFLTGLGANMSEGDRLLLGMDMVKSIEVLEKAYNDRAGVTAEFNLNILNVVNEMAKTDFRTEAFEHVAFYNEQSSRIEMHLRAKEDMEVYSPMFGESIYIHKGETIHTENSHKFTHEQIEVLALSAGLKIEQIFTDERDWFSLVLLKKCEV